MNKIPEDSLVRRVCEVIAADGPLTLTELSARMPDVAYCTLRTSRLRAIKRKALTCSGGRYHSKCEVVAGWLSILDQGGTSPVVLMRSDAFMRFVSPIPSHHPILACWALSRGQGASA